MPLPLLLSLLLNPIIHLLTELHAKDFGRYPLRNNLTCDPIALSEKYWNKKSGEETTKNLALPWPPTGELCIFRGRALTAALNCLKEGLLSSRRTYVVLFQSLVVIRRSRESGLFRHVANSFRRSMIISGLLRPTPHVASPTDT